MTDPQLKAVLISEKSYRESSLKRYSFLSALNLKKEDVKNIIENTYDVKVKAINSLLRKNKKVRTRKGMGLRKDMKKFIVTIKDGKTLDIFDIEKDNKKEEKSRKK